MKIYISTTDWGIVADLDETSLAEWLVNLEEQYPIGLNEEELFK